MLFLLFLLLLTTSIVVTLVIRSFEFMGLSEMRRQARSGNKEAKIVYRARTYGLQLWILLWAIIGLSSAGTILALDAMTSPLVALVLYAPILIFIHAILPWLKKPTPSLHLAAVATPILAEILRFCRPVLRRVERFVGKWVEPEKYRTIHSKEELLEILEATASKLDPVSQDELSIAEHALTFGDKLIGSVMTPKSVVKMIDANAVLGPIVLAELHDSGFSRFPVYKEKEDMIVGTLFLKDTSEVRTSVKVSEVMHKQVYFVNERAGLDQALNAFLRTHHHQFIVVNEFEDIVGVISIEDVLEQIVGKEIVDEFDQFEDMRAVAQKIATKTRKDRNHATPTPEKES